MTNAPENRKTHVIRIFGTNGAGEVLDSIWVDVERMDSAKSISSDDNGQGVVRTFKWLDDPKSDDYSEDGNPTRTQVTLRICDPHSDDLDNPEEWIPIKIIQHMKMVGSYDNYQGMIERLENDELNASRVVEKRRILHYDTNIDNDAQAAADGGDKVYVVKGDQYQRDETTKDEDQYVEVEVITYLKHRGKSFDHTNVDALTKRNNADSQGKQTKLLNQYLIEESVEAKLTEQGTNGFNPPYRLDPYQNIININIGSLAVEFLDGSK